MPRFSAVVCELIITGDLQVTSSVQVADYAGHVQRVILPAAHVFSSVLHFDFEGITHLLQAMRLKFQP